MTVSFGSVLSTVYRKVAALDCVALMLFGTGSLAVLERWLPMT